MVTTPDELEAALPEALSTSEPGIFHIRISATANRKKQQFGFDPTGIQNKRALAKKGAPKSNL
jgi:hypothetical protein